MERTPRIVEFHLDNIGIGWPSEKEIVDATVEFLNGATIRVNGQEHVEAEDEIRHLNRSLSELGALFERIRSLKCFRNVALLTAESDELSRSAGNVESRYRNLLRAIFCAFAWDPKATVGQFVEHEIVWHLRGETYLRQTALGMSIVHSYFLNSYIEIVSVGTSLLVDHTKKFGQKLSQCRQCGTFFWEVKPPKGRPQRRYCSEDHMRASHNIDAPNRAKMSRERKRLRNLARKKK